MSTQNTSAGNAETTKMVNPPKTEKMVTIEILRDCNVNLPGEKEAKIVPQGSKVDVTEEEAKRLLSIKYSGMYGFTGERVGDEFPKQTIKVARLWKETKKKDELEELDTTY